MESNKVTPQEFFLPLFDRDLTKTTNFSLLIYKVDPVSAALFLVNLKEKILRVGSTYYFSIEDDSIFTADKLDFMCVEYSKDLGEVRFYVNTSVNFNKIWSYGNKLMPLLNFPNPATRVNFDGTYINIFTSWKSKTHDKYKKYRFKTRKDIISEMSEVANLNTTFYEKT